MKFILTCACSGRDKKAITEYDILFPNSTTPEVVKGRDNLMKLATKYNNSHLRAIARLSRNFAYYVDIDSDGNILEEYDLATGKRIK